MFDKKPVEEVQTLLPHVIYLQDTSVNIEGINFHGSPWTFYKWTSYNRGFCREQGKIEHNWDRIPDNTNVVVTHLPPYGVMDTFAVKFRPFRKVYDNGGCKVLRQTVLDRVRPELHLFGHMHGCTGIESIDGTIFSNAAFPFREKAHVFDFYV